MKRTVDGGESWQRVDVGVPKVQLYTIESDGAGELVIAGKGVCVFSTDQGKTWHPARFEPTIEYGWIYGIAHLGPGRFVACGDEGAIYRKLVGSAWVRVDY